jgi:hypothetical protein
MKKLTVLIIFGVLIGSLQLSGCSALSAEPTPTLTNTATDTTIPATETFTPEPPTATYTNIPFTATITEIIPTNTPNVPSGPDVRLGEWYGRDVTDAFRLEFEIKNQNGTTAFDIITGVWEGRCTYAAAELRFIPLPEPLPIDQDGFFGNGFFDGQIVAPDRISGTFRYPKCPDKIIAWTGVYVGE